MRYLPFMALCVIMAFCFCGCASVKYETANGEKFRYSRIGWMEIQGFTADIGQDKKAITLESSKGTGGELEKVLLNLSELAKGAATP
ncbi:MAG: hypothetical protein E3K37_01375 [Candidatus Kuenenia sp.]|nr:hypothetical protein [Candidatus Kuenenia hertensis]